MIDLALRGCLALLLATLWASPSRAADGFEKVSCDRPIIPALIGARSGNSEPVVRIEARHKAIGLEDIGADDLGDGAGTITRRICGRSFVLLDIRNVTRDAIELPPHSRDAPAFSTGSCEVGGKRIEGDILGVFARAATEGAQMLPVKAAWRIDRKTNKFVPLEEGAACKTDGIYTRDTMN